MISASRFFLTEMTFPETSSSSWHARCLEFSNASLSPLRFFFGGRKVVIARDIILSDVPIYSKVEANWSRVFIDGIGLVAAIPLGVISRLFALMDANTQKYLGYLTQRDHLEMQSGILFEGISDRGLRCDDFEKIIDISGKVREQLELETQDVCLKRKLVITHNIFNFIILYPSMAYLADSGRSKSPKLFFSKGTEEWKMRQSYNKLVEDFMLALKYEEEEALFCRDEKEDDSSTLEMSIRKYCEQTSRPPFV